jgi:hypothetical protein
MAIWSPSALGGRIALERSMRQYRIYVLREDGRIGDFPQELMAESDDEVISKAQAGNNLHDIEIWQGERLVCQIRCLNSNDPKSPPADRPLIAMFRKVALYPADRR